MKDDNAVNSILSNFRLEDDDFAVDDVAEIMWLNTRGVADATMKLVDPAWDGYPAEVHKEIETQWDVLNARHDRVNPDNNIFPIYNSEILRFIGAVTEEKQIKIQVGTNLFYKDVTAVRSCDELFAAIENKPSAFVILNVLITADNKIVLGKRPYYGDWSNNTYELPGSFLKERDIATTSLCTSAEQRVRSDYAVTDGVTAMPLAVFQLPRVMETLFLCVTHIETDSTDMKSDIYDEYLHIENTEAGHKTLKAMNIELFHPPSRVALELYFSHFTLAQTLCGTAKKL